MTIEIVVLVNFIIMEAIVKKWLDYAKADLEAAEVLARHPKSHWSYQLAVLHCHQAVEKILKTAIVASGEEPKKIHDLVRLGELSKIKFSLEDQEYLKELNIHYQPSRYPDIFYKELTPRYSKENMEHHLAKTKKLFLWIKIKTKLKD